MAEKPKATALDALEHISMLYQYGAISEEEKCEFTESAMRLMAIKTVQAQDLLRYKFSRVYEKTSDGFVKKMCEKFVTQM